MSIPVYGKPGCKLCEAAKEKLQLLSIAYKFVDLESVPDDWRTNGMVAAMAEYEMKERKKLPLIGIDGVIYEYAEAMKILKGRGNNGSASGGKTLSANV